ncbi:major facilitator superfamily domain-containing protein [Stachybotrys elegans]|uniref:Major facilitator superfamily domain-containing protein n=1 Tax=Stachybotrys elegans TaxID=80388 RepID=A0A8K0SQE6_9HYPO|nr:major facilitator superfamily domain-containing protein [Stachybotrys elegans]
MLSQAREEDSSEGSLPTVNGVECDNAQASELQPWQRYLVLFIVSWNCLVVTSASTSLLVATPEIAATLHTTPEILNATNSGVLLAMGFSSLFWSPLSDIVGRRVSYNASLVVLFTSSIGTAVAPQMSVFTAMRILSGFTGTWFMVAGQTIIADLFPPLVRGRAVGCQMVGTVAGTALGPSIGGIIITYDNWRWIYWLQTCQAALGLVLSFLYIPSIASRVRQATEGGKDAPQHLGQLFNPIRVFRLFLKSQILLADLACGFLAVTQYALLSSVRHIINPRFNLTTPLISGLFYLSPGIGFMVGSLAGGRLSDHMVKRWIAKRDGLRLPKDRLNSGIVHLFFILPASSLLYGWGLHYDFGGIPLAIIMAFWIGIGLMGAWNGLNTYTGEVIPDRRSDVVCSKYVLQYVFAASATGMIVPMIDAIGVGWSFTICAFLHLAGGIIVVYVARYAPDKVA